MDVRTVSSTPAASHDGTARCLLAIELSKKSWVVAVNTPLAAKISRYTLQGHDVHGLLKLIERIVARVTRELAQPVEVISCYEAGYDGFWLHRLLESRGTRNHVIHRQAYKLTEERDEQRPTGWIPNGCFGH